MQRVKIKYTRKIKIPEKYKIFLWDEPSGLTFLEKFILRVFKYGNFRDIKWLFKKFPEECYEISLKYAEIKRGVKFWIKKWHNEGDR